MEALVDATLRLAAPLLIAALGELVVERSGVVNIGIEGTMLGGAFAGFAVAAATGSPLLGVVAAGAAGSALGALFAVCAVVRRMDQIVVGMAINLLALGATGLLSRAFYAGAPPAPPAVEALPLGALASLPVLGPAIFRQTAFVYGALVLALAVGVALARTRPGLRLRAVGESARAADIEGIAVSRTRCAAVVMGSFLAGVAGSDLSLALANTFTEGMTAGRGFIALAVVIFGRWSARGAVFAALFFGGATALQFRLQARGSSIPYPLFLMFPYVVTLAALAFASGRARAPADLGRAYRRESS